MNEEQTYAVLVEDQPDSMSSVRYDCESYDDAMAVVKQGLDHYKFVSIFRTYSTYEEEA